MRPSKLLLILAVAVLAAGCGRDDTPLPPAEVSPAAAAAPAQVAAQEPSLPAAPAGGAFVGGEQCRSCHEQEYQDWLGSHHDLAMQLPTEQTVLGDFDDSSFTYAGVTSRFSRRGDKFIVTTDGEDGTLQDFEVAYVFGVYPLQQYLLPLSRGRLQALSISWDSRPAEEGGQRWFHLYPDEAIDHSDPLHWTGHYQNWNARCAECHSTDLHKNYDPASDRYNTVFNEVNVSCEACHGPGESHVKLATEGTLANFEGSGFDTDLAQRGEWRFPEGEPIARRTETLDSRAQVDACGRCHARRGTLGEYHHGRHLLDTHRLSLLEMPLYYPDGQILDEVYVYGSFLQSKMHQAGVVCSNCHEPHTGEMRTPGNAICAQCHAPDTYDVAAHHHHETGSSGALCANCHMPQTTYMVVDPRRDHSMRVPRPDLSVVIGTPNACNQCHTDKDAQWALDATRDWGVTFRDTASHPARAFAMLAEGDARGLPTLAGIVADSTQPAIWRATALETVGLSGDRQVIENALALLQDDDPMLRRSAVRALGGAPAPQRLQILLPLADDPVTGVRTEVAFSLAEVPLDQIPPAQAQVLEGLFDEYVAIQALHTDMPGIRMQLGLFHAARGEGDKAEQQYLQAIGNNAILLPAYLNLADLYRAKAREDEARDILLRALEVMPDSGDTLHALGLLETRTGKSDAALDYLRQAAELEQAGTRHRFIYAIALHDLGQPRDAIAQLQALLRDVPRNQDTLLALANYHAELGERESATGYARQLLDIAPQNRGYQQLYRDLSGGP